MTMLRGARWTTLAVLLVALAATPAQAAEPGGPALTWAEEMLSAARVWLGGLISIVAEDDDDTTLKQHVDNPGQTPMKDGLIRIGG